MLDLLISRGLKIVAVEIFEIWVMSLRMMSLAKDTRRAGGSVVWVADPC